MRTIFEARLLFALGIIRFVLGLSDNKHLILLFPSWPVLVMTCDTRRQGGGSDY